MELDIKERVKILQILLNKHPLEFNNVKLAGYNLKFPKKSKFKYRTRYLIKPPFNYNKRKKYNFKFGDSYLDLFKKNNYYSLISISNLRIRVIDIINKPLTEIIKEFCCTNYYTYAYLWTRSIIESLTKRGYKITVLEPQLDFDSVVFYPLLSDLESEFPNLIINLSWYPMKCKINENVLNLSIFNNK